MTCQTRDVTEYQSFDHGKMSIIQAMVRGHIVTVQGEEYRFARKDQIIAEDETHQYAAMETNVFKKMYQFDAGVKEYTPENASGFRWMGFMGGDSMDIMFSLVDKMTEQERTEAIANFAFDNVKNNRKSAA